MELGEETLLRTGALETHFSSGLGVPPIRPPLLLSPRRDKGDPDTAGQTQASERAALHSAFSSGKSRNIARGKDKSKEPWGQERGRSCDFHRRQNPGLKGQLLWPRPSPAGPARSLALFTVAAIKAKDDKRFSSSLGGGEGAEKWEGERGGVVPVERKS